MPHESLELIAAYGIPTPRAQLAVSPANAAGIAARTDGQVLWWDTRKFSEPVEKMIVDLSRKQEWAKAEGVTALEYEPTIPTSPWSVPQTKRFSRCVRPS